MSTHFISDAVGGTLQSMNYPIVLGSDATAENFGGLVGFPTSVLISKDGRVVKRVDGTVSHEEIDKAIQSDLEPQTAPPRKRSL